MRLIVFIVSIFVLPFIACIASQSLPVCPRAKKGDLSSLANIIQTSSKKQWSKRGPLRQTHKLLAKSTSSGTLKNVIERATPFVYRPGFRVAWSELRNRVVAVKTYVRVTDLQAIQNEVNKWKSIGCFVGRVGDLKPGSRNIEDSEIHLIFHNPIPRFTDESGTHDPIKRAFSVQIRETPKGEAEEFLNHILANPQELFWKKWDNTWHATPIFFATESPIDKAISRQTRHPITEGEDFFTFRTMYKNRPATLKTYYGTTGSTNIFHECHKWSEINLLVGAAVVLTGHQFYIMILGNSVPEIALDDIHKTITKAVGTDATTHDFANPQEFFWTGWDQTYWRATRIRFITQDLICRSIEGALLAIRGYEFSILRAHYEGELVTLKTYSPITPASMGKIYGYLTQWMRIGLLIGAAVDLAPWDSFSHPEVTRFHILMNNSIPVTLKPDSMYAAIYKVLGNAAMHPDDFDNPQEYRWKNTKPGGRYFHKTWTATPIDFNPENENSISHHSTDLIMHG